MSDYKLETDEALVSTAIAGPEDDLRAFEELVRRYEQKVVTNCRYLSGSPEDAEDLAQEVMVKLFFGLPGFEGRASFRTWMMRIKSNHCINFAKKKRLKTVPLTAASASAEAGAVEPEAWRNMNEEEASARVGDVLLRMPETLRVPLVLRDMDGMGYQEIADALEIGLSAVKMRILRGRAEFRRLLKQAPGPTTDVERIGS